MVPKKDTDKIIIQWNVPYVEKDFNTMPLQYFSHLLGHEGENSIMSYLKKDGYVLSLTCGGSSRLECESYLYISIELTKKGLANYEKVIEAVFHYN